MAILISVARKFLRPLERVRNWPTRGNTEQRGICPKPSNAKSSTLNPKLLGNKAPRSSNVIFLGGPHKNLTNNLHQTRNQRHCRVQGLVPLSEDLDSCGAARSAVDGGNLAPLASPKTGISWGTGYIRCCKISSIHGRSACEKQ